MIGGRFGHPPAMKARKCSTEKRKGIIIDPAKAYRANRIILADLAYAAIGSAIMYKL